MSDIASQSDPSDLPEGEAIEQGDQQTAQVEPEPTPEAWADFDSYKDQHVQVVVDGEPQLVPLAELRDGYQRQADYTRKTQELAAQRQELAQVEQLYRALDADPAGTLRLLQTAYQDQLAPEAPDPEDEFLTDEQREIKALKQQLDGFIQTQTSAQVTEQLDKELNGLVEHWGLDDAAKQQLIDFAVERDYTNFTDAWARLRLENENAAAADRAQLEARQEAARAAQVVSGAQPRNPAAQPSIQPRVGQSVRESVQQAMAMLESQ